MPPLPLPTSTRISSPSAHNSLLTTRSTSSEDPLIPLYVILGVLGGVFALLVLAITFLLGGCCCCYQARKAYQNVANNRRHKTFNTHNHKHWHRHSNPSSNSTSRYWSHESAMGPRSSHYIQAAPSEPYKASPSNDRASFDDHPTSRLALTYQPSSHTKHLQRSESRSYPLQPQVHRIHNRSPSPLSRSVSTSGHHTNHSPPSDIYMPRQPFESHKQSQSPSHLLLARPEFMPSRMGPYDYHYRPSRRPKPPYESLSRRSSRERSERRASRPDQLPSLSSDGRPGLSSDC